MKARKRSAVLDCLERLRRRCPGANLTHALGYFYICENEGINFAELAIVLRTTRPTASRTARALMSEGLADAMTPYLGLVEVRPNPDDARGKTLWLSAVGKTLRDDMDRVIEQAQPLTPGPA